MESTPSKDHILPAESEQEARSGWHVLRAEAKSQLQEWVGVGWEIGECHLFDKRMPSPPSMLFLLLRRILYCLVGALYTTARQCPDRSALLGTLATLHIILTSHFHPCAQTNTTCTDSRTSDVLTKYLYSSFLSRSSTRREGMHVASEGQAFKLLCTL